jgi:hypothetical protein
MAVQLRVMSTAGSQCDAGGCQGPRGVGIAELQAELAAIQADHARLRTAMVQNL